MRIPNLAGIGDFLGRLLLGGRTRLFGPGDPGQGDPLGIGQGLQTPGSVTPGGGPIPLGGGGRIIMPSSGLIEGQVTEPDPMALSGLLSDLKDALGVKGEAPPKPSERKIDPVEAAAAAIAASGSSLPSVHSRLGMIPMQLAEQRGATVDAGAMADWQGRQSGADARLKVVPQIIGMAMDRDSVAAKIASDEKKAEIAGAAKTAVAQMRTNAQIGKAILDLDGKGQLNAGSLASVLVMNGMADPAHAQGVAESAIADLTANPNAWYGLQTAKANLDQEKLDRGLALKEQEDDQKIVESLEAPFTSKLAAIGRLQARGLLPPGDPVAMADEISTRAANMNAQTLLAKTREDYQKKLKELLPAEQASRIASRQAQIDHLRNADQMAMAEFDFKKSDSARKEMATAYKEILGSIGNSIVALTSDVVSARDKRKTWEAKRAEIPASDESDRAKKARAEIDGFIAQYDSSITSKLAQRAGLMQKAGEVRQKMEADAVSLEDEAAKTVETPRASTSAPGGAVKGSDGVWRLPGSQASRGGGGASLAPKAEQAKASVMEAFPKVTDVEGVANRNVRGSSRPSDHASGKALDFKVGDSKLGNSVAAYLIAHAKEMGVRYLIWNGQFWKDDGKGWRDEKGIVPAAGLHKDHVHASFE